MPGFTRAAIKAAFIELLEEYPLKKITVKDIVERCGVNRNSFYYHYQDIPSLMGEIITETADTIMGQYKDYNSGEDFLCSCIDYAMQHRKALMHIYHSVSRDVFEKNLVRVCDYVIRIFLDDMLKGRAISDSDREAIEWLYRCECVGFAAQWLMEGMKEGAQEQVHRICTLRKGMIEEMIRRCIEG